jgi:hypothetical protein
MESLAWFENTPLSLWVRESPLVFPTILIIHALGMGALVGVNVLLGLRAFGLARSATAASLERFIPIMWLGFIACLGSGLMLLAGYPAKALTNGVFYLKFILMGAAFVVSLRLRRRLVASSHEELAGSLPVTAAMLLLLWAGVISAGRFLAYTHTVLLAYHLI